MRKQVRVDVREVAETNVGQIGAVQIGLLKFMATVILLGALVACSKPPQTPAAETPAPTGLESIPMPDPAKYPPLNQMSGWKNPYFVVREDGIGFVDLSNREVHILKVEEIPAELAALPSSAWPYGRVVLIAQAALANPSDQAKAELRKNRALLLGTLKELDVQYREAP
ncbi:MAG: hypothetical protein WCF61_20330 [Terriglobales bacterium]